jgi:hypothetical protein
MMISGRSPVRPLRAGWILAPVLVSLPGRVLAGAAPAALINEVLYDPTGADSGAEFVEVVLAPGAPPLDLARLRLERGNGQRPGDWKTVWQGVTGDSLAGARHFVVGGAAVEPRPDAIADLELQNGPDACRLLVDGQVADVVGWGELEASEFFTGEPAPDVEAGSSLGRVPDGRTTGRNRADFLALPAPSPGRPNRRPPAVRVRSRHHSRADPFPTLLLEVALEAVLPLAHPALATASVELIAFAPAVPGPQAAARLTLSSGHAAGILALGPLPPGLLTVGLEWRPELALAGEETARDTLFIPVRVGAGPLLVNEFLFRPPPGEPEWIELIHPGPDSLRVATFAVGDEDGDPVELEGAPTLPPGGFLVIAEAPMASVPEAFVLGARWPRLNDAGAPAADRIQLVDGERRTSDAVEYGADWAPAGVSVERLSLAIGAEERSAWTAAPAGPTPGRPNGAARELRPVSGALAVDPSLVRAGAGGAVLFRLAEPVRSGAITVHAADGRLVRRFGTGELVGHRIVRFDPSDSEGASLPAGLYLVSLAGEVDRGPASPGAPPRSSPARVEARATLVVLP